MLSNSMETGDGTGRTPGMVDRRSPRRRLAKRRHRCIRSWQVFGLLVGRRAGARRLPTARRFPAASRYGIGPVPLTRVVTSYRCGAAPESVRTCSDRASPDSL